MNRDDDVDDDDKNDYNDNYNDNYRLILNLNNTYLYCKLIKRI